MDSNRHSSKSQSVFEIVQQQEQWTTWWSLEALVEGGAKLGICVSHQCFGPIKTNKGTLIIVVTVVATVVLLVVVDTVTEDRAEG